MSSRRSKQSQMEAGELCFRFRSFRRWRWWGFFHVVQYAQVSSHVAERFFGDGEFAQVVAPDIFAGAAAGVGFAGDAAYGSVGFATEESLGRHKEGYALASLPEVASEVVREEENVVAALLRERGGCLYSARPWEIKRANVPAAEFEAVEPGLTDEKLNQFKFRHRMCGSSGLSNRVGCITTEYLVVLEEDRGR